MAGDAASLAPYIASLASCPKTGLHNPLRSPERYVALGRVCERAAAALKTPEIAKYFSRLVQRTSPKSDAQAAGEVAVVAAFLANFAGDNVRFLARSFGVPGDHDGQTSRGYRFPCVGAGRGARKRAPACARAPRRCPPPPRRATRRPRRPSRSYGPVAIITPYNFPIEIPVLQVMGALFMGNRPLLKVDSKVSVVMEQFLRLLHACGLPAGDVDFINTDGPTMNKLLVKAQPRMTLFTGCVQQRLQRLVFPARRREPPPRAPPPLCPRSQLVPRGRKARARPRGQDQDRGRGV